MTPQPGTHVTCTTQCTICALYVVRPGELGTFRFAFSPFSIRVLLGFLPVIPSAVVELRVTALALALRVATSLVVLIDTVVCGHDS